MYYFDNNATTKPFKECVDMVHKVMLDNWHNPSSGYPEGKLAYQLIEEARERISEFLNCSSSDLVFTSIGTECNHLVFSSIIETFPKPHIITSCIEHESVINVLERFHKDGVIDLSICQVDQDTGYINPDELMKLVRQETRLISVMTVNNVTGIVQPIREIADRIKQYRDEKGSEIFFHTDACQSVAKMNLDVSYLGVDYATIDGHKFYAPKVGVLYVRDCLKVGGAPARPTLIGGSQERNLRSGTQNTPLIAGIGLAMQIIRKNFDSYISKLTQIREKFEQELCSAFQKEPLPKSSESKIKLIIFGVDKCRDESRWREDLEKNPRRVSNTLTIAFEGEPWINSKRILHFCPEVRASRGAACQSLKRPGKNPNLDGSEILIKHGYSDQLAASAIRLSFGIHNSFDEIRPAVALIHAAVEKALEELM